MSANDFLPRITRLEAQTKTLNDNFVKLFDTTKDQILYHKIYMYGGDPRSDLEVATKHYVDFMATASGGVLLKASNGGARALTIEFPQATLSSDPLGVAAWVLTFPSFSASGTVTLINTASGIVGGPITSTGTIGLSNTGVTAGTYDPAKITVGSDGRISSASNSTLPIVYAIALG